MQPYSPDGFFEKLLIQFPSFIFIKSTIVREPGTQNWAIGTKRGTKLDPIILIDYVPEYSFPLTGSSYLVA